MDLAVLAFRYGIAFVFLLASVPKLVDAASFERAVRGYALVPDAWARPLVTWLPRFEFGASLALLSGVGVPVVGVLLTVALLLFAGAIGVNLLRGRAIDCGCFGGSAPRRITWIAVVRNAVLAAMAATVAVTAWPDFFVGLGGGRQGISTIDSVAILVTATIVVPGALLLREWRSYSLAASSVIEHAREGRR